MEAEQVATGIIYASIAHQDSSAQLRLQTSVTDFLKTCGAGTSNIWTLSYACLGPDPSSQQAHAWSEISERVLSFAPRPFDIAFPDEVLGSVKEVWKTVVGGDAHDDAFLRFEARETEVDTD